MNFPVIVKDTLGAGSIGVEVMNSYEEERAFLIPIGTIQI